MARTIAATLSFLVLMGGAFVASQAHPEQHAQTRSHDASGHAAMDPAQHAALHALLGSDWHGTLSPENGLPTPISVKVSRDHAGLVGFEMTGDSSRHIGASTQITADDHTVRWVQDISGTPCKATADLVAATERSAERWKGKMSCAGENFTLTLTKAMQ